MHLELSVRDLVDKYVSFIQLSFNICAVFRALITTMALPYLLLGFP